MKVKLLKSVLVNSISNVEPVKASSVVEVPDDEGKELVKAGYAEEYTAKVTADAKRAQEPENKMAPDASNKDGERIGSAASAPAPASSPSPSPAPAGAKSTGSPGKK